MVVVIRISKKDLVVYSDLKDVGEESSNVKITAVGQNETSEDKA